MQLGDGRLIPVREQHIQGLRVQLLLARLFIESNPAHLLVLGLPPFPFGLDVSSFFSCTAFVSVTCVEGSSVLASNP
jgi:hypothetical protein